MSPEPDNAKLADPTPLGRYEQRFWPRDHSAPQGQRKAGGECPPPISLALGAEPKGYVDGLGRYRAGDVSAWCERFAYATAEAVREAKGLASDIGACQADWLARLGNPRSDAVVRQIVAVLPGAPVIDVPSAQRLTGKSHVAVGNALARLQSAGVLVPLGERRWGRVWECAELLALLEAAERRIATSPQPRTNRL